MEDGRCISQKAIQQLDKSITELILNKMNKR